jgi:hypothetical protein
MFWSALGRPMTPQEQTVMVQFLQSSSDSSPAAKQEAWTQMAHALFNLKEFAFVN